MTKEQYTKNLDFWNPANNMNVISDPLQNKDFEPQFGIL